MTKVLLDTTVLVDVERSGGTLDEVIDDDEEVAVAAVTVVELLVGVSLADDRHRADRQAFLDELVVTVPVIDYDRSVARSHAQLLVEVRRQGRPRGAHDLIIAATAVATKREVVSGDTSAFEDLPGVRLRR